MREKPAYFALIAISVAQAAWDGICAAVHLRVSKTKAASQLRRGGDRSVAVGAQRRCGKLVVARRTPSLCCLAERGTFENAKKKAITLTRRASPSIATDRLSAASRGDGRLFARKATRCAIYETVEGGYGK